MLSRTLWELRQDDIPISLDSDTNAHQAVVQPQLEVDTYTIVFLRWHFSLDSQPLFIQGISSSNNTHRRKLQ